MAILQVAAIGIASSEKTDPFASYSDIERFDAGLQYFAKRDYRNAWDALLPLAQDGNARAAYYLGAMRDPQFHQIGEQYYEMKYLKLEAAIHWYRIAENDKDAYALHGLSQVYKLDLPDMPINKARLSISYGKKAYKHLKPLSEHGDAVATYKIAEIRFGENNFQFWSTKAGEALTECALRGDMWCQFYLGKYYLFSMPTDASIDRDLFAKSFAWFTIASDSGNAHGDAFQVIAAALMTEKQYPVAEQLVAEYKNQILNSVASQ